MPSNSCKYPHTMRKTFVLLAYSAHVNVWRPCSTQLMPVIAVDNSTCTIRHEILRGLSHSVSTTAAALLRFNDAIRQPLSSWQSRLTTAAVSPASNVRLPSTCSLKVSYKKINQGSVYQVLQVEGLPDSDLYKALRAHDANVNQRINPQRNLRLESSLI